MTFLSLQTALNWLIITIFFTMLSWREDSFGQALEPATVEVMQPLAREQQGLISNLNLQPVKQLPSVFTPATSRDVLPPFPWKTNIATTVFWVGEKPAPGNPISNTASSWDTRWSRSFGGFDDPDQANRSGYLPKAFVPKQNPFYLALPYNDIAMNKRKQVYTKTSAHKIPWYEQSFYRGGRTVLKGRWVAVRFGDKICYGQWEDVGPFLTNDHSYVFGDNRPKTKGNGGAGLDVSPAIRDYLGFRWIAKCDWRFVDLHEVPDGPWKQWGSNNPFVPHSKSAINTKSTVTDSLHRLRRMRDKAFGG